MIAALLAVLSLASSPAMPAVIDVPYMAQTDALCGGAAAAMVFRYWGDAHADVQQFAPLVDPSAGGIADDVLVRAIETRGWRADRFEGSLSTLETRIADRQPVIVLVADRGPRYHYLVVTGVSRDAVIVHDPSWGPSRAISREDFLRRWGAARFWSLVVLPTANVTRTEVVQPVPSIAVVSRDERCDALLNGAVERIQSQGLDGADDVLAGVRARCPRSAGPIRELSGLRFAQRKWHEAATLARESLALEPRDPYTVNLLGTSLFLQDDTAGALAAWNRIDKPRLDIVRIEGVRHTRHQAIAQVLDLRIGSLLTAGAYTRAARRLDELPDRSSARLTVVPDADGFASVDAAVAEQAFLPHTWPEWVATAARAGVDREITASLPGFNGQGEIWSASWRWWSNRPRAALSFAVPRWGLLPGVWRIDGSWEAETYSGNPRLQASVVREERSHGGLTVSDWLSGSVRYAVDGGFDAWNTGRRTTSFGAAVERRWFADRLSASADARSWLSMTREAGFSTGRVRVAARSSTNIRPWIAEASIGAERASDKAPLAIWPGAGEGQVRTPLLRAHPLLDDGIIDLSGISVFGRTLACASAEGQRWLARPALVRLGLAAFADVARADRRVADGARMQTDVGVGLRVRTPGAERVLRIDFAHGLRDNANALTIGFSQTLH